MGTQSTTQGVAAPVSFNRHGPFYRLQRRLGILSDMDLAAGRRALLFLVLAWVPVLLLAALQGYALDAHHERALLFDFSAYAFALATVAFVLMEQTSDQGMAWLVGQFTVREIANESSRECFAQARQNMARRTGSGLVEAVILVGAYVIAYVWIQGGAGRVEGGTWFGQVQDGDLRLTLAGWWLLLVALPLFWFLLGRWLWRFATWVCCCATSQVAICVWLRRTQTVAVACRLSAAIPIPMSFLCFPSAPW